MCCRGWYECSFNICMTTAFKTQGLSAVKRKTLRNNHKSYCNHCKLKMVFPPACLQHLITWIVSHLPQNNLPFRHLGISVMWSRSHEWRKAKAFIPNFRSLPKYCSEKYLCHAAVFSGVPLSCVFATVQALSLGAVECLWAVLLYGFEFRTARVLVFDLGWCWVAGHTFPSFKNRSDRDHPGKLKTKPSCHSYDYKETGLQSVHKQPLTMSCPTSW